MPSKRTPAEVKQKFPTCSSIPFEYVAHFFDNVSSVTKTSLKRKHLAAFRNFYINREADDIFQLYRLLLPGLDQLRGSYGLKESMLGSVLLKACGIPDGSDAAKAIRDWKKPHTRFAGDFTAVLYHYLILPNCGREEGTLRSAEYSVGDVNSDLDALTRADDRITKVSILKSMLMKTTPKQMKWITRLVLGNLKIGLTENVVLPDFHQDAVRLYDSTMDLEKVCRLLKSTSVRHQIKDIEPGIPVRSQLAARRNTAQEIINAMGIRDFVVEIKFDGERCQLHKRGDELMYFSRRGIEHGHNSSYNIFNAAALKQITVENCILDGELVIWNKETGCFEPFGSLRPTVHAAIHGTWSKGLIEYQDFREDESINRVHHLPDLKQLEFHYIAFDILFVNDRSVTVLPLSERHKLLKSTIKNAPLNGTPIVGGLHARLIPLIPDQTILSGQCLTKTGVDIKDISDMFNTALLMQEEGIVVKALESPWLMNNRGDNWLKLKPEYVSNHEVDAVVIGGYYGTGKNANTVSEFLLGVLDTASTGDARYVSFCRVGTGLSDRERSQLDTLVRPLFKKLKKVPTQYRVTGHHKETPNVWITDPTASAVLEIKADIRSIPSDVFATGYTLRFPRVTAIRTDKGHEDIMTLQELNTVVHSRYGNLSHKKRTATTTPTKTPRRRRRIFSVPPRFQQTPLKKRKAKSDCLRGLIVYFGDYGPYEKERLESIAQELGAVVHMSPSREISFALGHDPESQNLKRLAYYEKYDIVSVEWLLRCDEENARVQLKPRDYLWRSAESAQNLTHLLEGQDPLMDIDVEDIQQVVERHMEQYMIRVKHENTIKDPYTLCDELQMESLFPGSTALQGCVFLMVMDKDHGIADPEDTSMKKAKVVETWSNLQAQMTVLKIQSTLLRHGAEVTEDWSDSVTHVIVDDSSDLKMKSARDFLEGIASAADSEARQQWVYDSIVKGRLHIVQSSWLSQLHDVHELKDEAQIMEHLPAFAREGPSSRIGKRRLKLAVDTWPWADFLPGWTPCGESSELEATVSAGAVSMGKELKGKTTSPAIGRSIRSTSTKKTLSRTVSRAISTPPPKRSKPAHQAKALVDPASLSTDYQDNPTSNKRPSKKHAYYFSAILDNPDADVLNENADADRGDEEPTTVVEHDAMDRTPPRTRSRRRSRSPETPVSSTPSNKKTSARAKLRSLRRS